MSFILAASDINNVAVDTIMSALLIILTLLAIIVTVWLLVRNINIEYTHINVTKTMLIVVGIGVLLRFGCRLLRWATDRSYTLYTKLRRSGVNTVPDNISQDIISKRADLFIRCNIFTQDLPRAL